MPSRRQRKVRAAAAAVADTRAVEVDIDSPLLTDEAINSMLVAYSNSGRHAMEAAEAACGDAEAWITTIIELIMADLERDIAQRGGLSFELAEIQQRIRAVFEDIWDGQIPTEIPEISDHSGNPIVMAAQAQGEAKIDKRVGTGTGARHPGARHPGARPTMEEMIVEARHRSKGTGGKAQEHKQSKGALEEDLGGRLRLPKPRSSGCIDEKVWSGAVETARGQVKQEYSVPGTLDAYYKKMCKPGKKLLAGEVHRRAQLLYDYRAGKAIYRENRKLK